MVESNACELCAAPVPVGAKKCASCGSWLIPFRQRPVGRALIVVVAILVALVIVVFASRTILKRSVNNQFDQIEKNL